MIAGTFLRADRRPQSIRTQFIGRGARRIVSRDMEPAWSEYGSSEGGAPSFHKLFCQHNCEMRIAPTWIRPSLAQGRATGCVAGRLEDVLVVAVIQASFFASASEDGSSGSLCRMSRVGSLGLSTPRPSSGQLRCHRKTTMQRHTAPAWPIERPPVCHADRQESRYSW